MNEILRISFYVVLRFILKGDVNAEKRINYIRFGSKSRKFYL